MIHPDVEAAEAIVKAVEHGAISDIVDFGDDGEFEIAALQIASQSKLDGKSLKDIRTLTEKKFLVVYHETKEEGSDNTVTNLPGGDSVLHAGDRIAIITKKDDIPSLLELCGIKIDAIKKIALVGIGRIGTIVADRIIEKDKSSLLQKIFNGTKRSTQTLTIIDNDKKLCEEAEEKFPQAKVFNADITDDSFIEEEKIFRYNLVICATHNHEMNMVVSAYLESLGVEKTIALVAQSQFGNIARKLGIDVAIPMRDTLVDSIISHLHGKSVTGIHTVANGEFEIVECDLPSSSKFIGKQLKDIASPGEFLILLVRKPGGAKYELPQGNTFFPWAIILSSLKKPATKKCWKNSAARGKNDFYSFADFIFYRFHRGNFVFNSDFYGDFLRRIQRDSVVFNSHGGELDSGRNFYFFRAQKKIYPFRACKLRGGCIGVDFFVSFRCSSALFFRRNSEHNRCSF
jgi:trk system potassium uptake protein TrkA